MAAEAKPSGEPGWKWRRAVIFPVVAFALWRLAVMENAPDTELNQTIASGWLWLIGLTIFVYAGFATVQDVIAIWRTRSATPYKQEPSADPESAEPMDRCGAAPHRA